MKRYTVIWEQHCLDKLAHWWLVPENRGPIERASREMDRQLLRDPSHAGDDLHEGLRRLVVEPLQVLFEVSEDDRLVKVVDIKWFNSPHSS